MRLPHPCCVLLACAALALAGCGPSDSAPERSAPPAAASPGQWGEPGDPAAARRTIRITLSDGARCVPAIVEVGHNETVRFEVHNAGTVPQELVIGPAPAADAARRTQLAPGGTGTLAWNFSRAGEVRFSCRGPAGDGTTGTIRVVEPPDHKH